MSEIRSGCAVRAAIQDSNAESVTDKDKLLALLDALGVGYEIREAVASGCTVECVEGMDKVDGYCQFFTSFEFDAAGKFEKMGCWE